MEYRVTSITSAYRVLLEKQWAFQRSNQTAVKTSIGFTPSHLVYGKEALFPIEVELLALKLLEKLLGPSNDAFAERLLHMQ